MKSKSFNEYDDLSKYKFNSTGYSNDKRGKKNVEDLKIKQYLIKKKNELINKHKIEQENNDPAKYSRNNYNKYLKYKLKYLELKKILEKN